MEQSISRPGSCIRRAGFLRLHKSPSAPQGSSKDHSCFHVRLGVVASKLARWRVTGTYIREQICRYRTKWGQDRLPLLRLWLSRTSPTSRKSRHGIGSVLGPVSETRAQHTANAVQTSGQLPATRANANMTTAFCSTSTRSTSHIALFPLGVPRSGMEWLWLAGKKKNRLI